MKNETAFSVDNIKAFKTKMLDRASRFNIFCLLDNNEYNFETPAFECLMALGCKRSFSFTDIHSFDELQQFYDARPSWLFGHLGYNAGHIAYGAQRKAAVDFGDGFFFEPEFIIRLTKKEVIIYSDTVSAADELFREINGALPERLVHKTAFSIKPVLTKAAYIQAIENLQRHIKRGDCYEINFCQPFMAHDATLSPVEVYEKLTAVSPNPFGAFYKLNDKYCFCASPERFFKKEGRTLISQPIKGTTRRDHTDPLKDAANKALLLQSSKEKSENVMIVDLVRNDLSMVAARGSVFVKELFGLYSFPQVHQMISTVQATLEEGKTFSDALKACFPMGSMTGAPKKKVMELIAQYEPEARGLFSGSIGYITPQGDVDLNVVIRSIFYDDTKKLVSLFAGSGITFYCEAESEYDECMAKAEAMMKVLQ